jgi:hypothetical protein
MKVCASCFNDIELKQFIESSSNIIGKCDYCSSLTDSALLEIEELLDFFAEFIGIFKEDTNGIALVKLIQDEWNLFSTESNHITLLSDILKVLNSPITSPLLDVSYVDEIIECTSYWETLKEDLKWNRRFLTNIEKLNDLGWDSFLKEIIELPKTEHLYRARIHFNGEKVPFGKAEMGFPSKDRTFNGRANPQGIPYLYLSKELETTLYETRAIYYDDLSIGQFQIKNQNNIVVVDFTETGSPFSNIGQIIEYVKRIRLKKHISIDLSKPIRRYDSELEYLPTQFICEFIRYITVADGILFDSSLHKGGKNIVLFNQEKVECTEVNMYRVNKVEINAEKIITDN